MLLELRIGHLALVDEITVRLGPGLTVLTGETGAGKSLIAGAMALLCGDKADKDLVRQGEEMAYVEGVFDLNGDPQRRRELARAGVHLAADHILVLRREIRRQGRSRVLINGLVTSLLLLQTIGSRLLSIQSQDQQRDLDAADFARHFLDSQLNTHELVAEVRRLWQHHQQCQAAYLAREREEAVAQEQLSLWEYQHAELADASLQEGEEEQLADSLTLKRHASTLQEGAAHACQLLSEGEQTVREMLGQSITTLQPLADKSRKLQDVMTSLREAETILADAAADLVKFLADLDLDPADLEELEERKALYEELRRKYRRDTSELLKYHQLLAERIERQRMAATDLATLEQELASARSNLERIAEELHERRVAGSARVAASAAKQLRPLALPHLDLNFRVGLREQEGSSLTVCGCPCHVSAHGGDDVELYVRTNPGERMGPVAAIASGGERSRIHLGLTVMQQDRTRAPLLLFDEIDAGLGMDAAPPIAALLTQLAAHVQVICITHLPTMAVHGTRHLKVSKQVQGGRTELTLTLLEGTARIDEIARLLGGEGWQAEDGTSQRVYAEELLRSGQLARRAQL